MNSIIISALLTVAGSVWGILRVRGKKVQKIATALEKWVPIVFDVINNMMAQKMELQFCNKTRLFVDELSKVLEANGIALTPEITRQAVAMVDAMHYREKSARILPVTPCISSTSTTSAISNS